MAKLDNLIFENARIMFRNFEGRVATYNSLGDRNFCLFMSPEKGEAMKTEGWNVKYLPAREEGEEPQPYVEVAVNYNKGRPPRIVLLSNQGRNRTELDGETVKILDRIDIKNIDVILNPYEWVVNEKTGVKAYLKTAFVTLYEDELELKYAEDPTNQTPTTANLTVLDAAGYGEEDL